MPNLERGLQLSLIAAGTILFTVATASFVGSTEWSGIAREVAISHDLSSEIDHGLAAITDAETGQRGFILTGDPIYLSEYYQGAAESRRTIAKLRAWIQEFPELQADTEVLSVLVEQKLRELAMTVALRQSQGFSQAQAVVAQGQGRTAMMQIRALIAKMRDVQKNTLTKRQERMRRSRAYTGNMSIAGSLLAMIIVVVSLQQGSRTVAAARRARLMLDAFLRNNPSLISIKDSEGRFIYCNPAFESAFQLRSIDWKDRDEGALWPPDVAAKLRNADAQVMAASSSLEVIDELPLPGGELREFLSVKFPFPQDDGVYIGSISMDVTERRAAAARLKASEEFNRSILESSSDCIKVLDLDGRLLSMNENGQRCLEISDFNTVLFKDWGLFWNGNERQAASLALAAGRRGETTKFEGYGPDLGRVQRWWEIVVSPIRGESGAVSKLLVVSRDSTDKRTADAQLRSSELRYRNLFEHNPLPAWIHDQNTLRFLDVNQTAIDRYGYSREEFLQMRVSDVSSPEDSDTTEPGHSRHLLKDGSQITVELTSRQIDWSETPAHLIMVRDISEKLASEEKFRCLFERSGDAILVSYEGKVVDCNPAAVAMLGATGAEQVIGMTPVQLLAEVQPNGARGEELAAAMRAETARVGGLRKDLLHRRLNGEEFLVDLSMTGVNIGGRQMRMVIWHDLTERRRAEEAVRKSEQRLREAQQIARLGSWDYFAATEHVEWSDETYVIFDMNPLSPISIQEIGKRIHPDDLARVVRQRNLTMADGSPYDLQYRLVWSSGEVRHIHSLAQRHVDKNGTPTRLSGTVLDITEQTRVHQALRESESRFHAFMDNSPALAFIKDREGRMVYMNRICQSMWNLDRLDWQGKSDAELWSPSLAQEFRKLDLIVLDSGVAGRNIDVVPLPDGETCSLLTHKFPLQFHGGEPLLGGISLDISDQKNAEREALDALADKEVLLQEVHHRVKNNLQIICSLLGMQSASSNDEKTIGALRESQNRVQSMAMIHELLYGSKTLADIDFLEYAERLAVELELSYGLGSRVRIRIRMAALHLSIDQAIPCGLILNELITNSLKYAFPEDRQGQIVVSLTRRGSDRATLVVQDDGAGLPPEFQLQSAASLGLRIVQILAKQLDGTLHVESSAGTRFEIVFPLVSNGAMHPSESIDLPINAVDVPLPVSGGR